MNLSETIGELESLLDAHREWLLIDDGKTFALGRNEIELRSAQKRILFGFLNEKGFHSWNLSDWKSEEGRISLELSAKLGRENLKLLLVPRVALDELKAVSEIARIERANRISRLFQRKSRGSRITRIALDQENSRFAQIIVELRKGEEIAILADVSDKATPEIFLSTAILWFSHLQSRKRNRVREIWLVANERTAKNLSKLCACLRAGWVEKLRVFSITLQEGDKKDQLLELKLRDAPTLWRAKPTKLSAKKFARPSKAAREIIALAPNEIDIMFSTQGETLRFNGLPFARVRKIFDEEKVWFGVDRRKRALDEKSLDEFSSLVENLKMYRSFETPNPQHEFFRLAPENWLEAILRRDISQLDGNLILSPLYTQFRAERDRIDLLALRSDGRLAIIELKTSADREMIFQAVDYWRKIEHQRRAQHLQRINLFGSRQIKDEPTLVYLVAPALDFHREANFFASCVSNEIEIFRVAINQNWRARLKVIERQQLEGKVFRHRL
jgi:hypothetical protein